MEDPGKIDKQHFYSNIFGQEFSCAKVYFYHGFKKLACKVGNKHREPIITHKETNVLM